MTETKEEKQEAIQFETEEQLQTFITFLSVYFTKNKTNS